MKLNLKSPTGFRSGEDCPKDFRGGYPVVFGSVNCPS